MQSARSLSAYWLLLAFAALLLRAIVPQGHMASVDDTGAITVKICNSDAVWSIPLGEKGNRPDGEESADRGHCAFAGGQLAGDLAAPINVPAMVFAISAPAIAAFQALAIQRLRPAPPSRGPPQTV